MTVAEAIKLGTARLRAANIESARLDTFLLLGMLTHLSQASLLAHPEMELEHAITEKFVKLVGKRAERVPLVHLTHSREFYGLDFYITEHVLTPRVETEKMAGLAIKYAPKSSRLVDIGTGSGALAIAIKKHRPDLDVTATDITDEALAVAKNNATRLRAEIMFKKSDLFAVCNPHPPTNNDTFLQGDSLQGVQGTRPSAQDYCKESPCKADGILGRFATVVTNLPYLRDDADLMPEVQKEPDVALFGGTDGLDLYRRFLRQLPEHLEPNGYLFTECDPWQQDDLIDAAAKVKLRPIEQDYFILGFRSTPSD